MKKHKIPIPEEEFDHPTLKREEERIDGVYLEGELTYNITEKNLTKAKEEVAVLREVNGQQKEEIVRLKSELMRKESSVPVKEGVNPQGYHNIGESIAFIMKGLQSKENADMKSIIS
jgi:hypothetical protein